MAMTQQEFKEAVRPLEKKAHIYRAELVLNPFDLNALHNLNLLDQMFITILNQYLN
jgi:hypothetical protein